MYLEWDLYDIGLIHGSNSLRNEIDLWAIQTEIVYKIKIVKHKFRLILSSEQDYSHFTLSWNPTVKHRWQNWMNEYRFVEPMKVDKHR
jgi:hypothetical protein